MDSFLFYMTKEGDILFPFIFASGCVDKIVSSLSRAFVNFPFSCDIFLPVVPSYQIRDEYSLVFISFFLTPLRLVVLAHIISLFCPPTLFDTFLSSRTTTLLPGHERVVIFLFPTDHRLD